MIKYMKMSHLTRIITIACLVSGMAALSSCNKEITMTDSQKAFTQMAQPGLVSGNAYTIEFSASGYQLSSTTDGKYRIMADDQSQYVEAAVSGDLGKIGSSNKVLLKWFKQENLSEKELTMILSHSDNKTNTYWLWNEEESTGVIIRKLI